jgi:hypothetical protein
VILSGYALGWLGERVATADWPIEEVANPLRVWPRNLWFVALAIVAAVAIRQFDTRRDALREIDDASPDDVDRSTDREMART